MKLSFQSDMFFFPQKDMDKNHNFQKIIIKKT